MPAINTEMIDLILKDGNFEKKKPKKTLHDAFK